MSVDSSGIRIRRNSLAVRLGGAFLILTTMAVLVVGVTLILISRQAQRDSVFVQQQRAAREIALAISAYIDNNVGEISLVGQTQNLLDADDAEAKAILEILLAARRSRLGTLALIDAGGQERVKISQFHAYLADELVNQKETELFTRAIAGQTFVSPIYLSPQSGLLAVQIAIPLQTGEGQVSAVLAAEVLVTRLWQELARIEIGETGYTYIVDNTGNFIAHQEPAQILQRYGEDMTHIPPVAEFVAGGQVGASGSYEYQGLDQERVIGNLVPIAGTDWGAVVEISTGEAYASVQRMQWLLVGLTALGVVLAAVFGYVIQRQLIRPIRNLTISAEQIAAGNLDAELIMPQRADEIGVLAHAFQQMQTELGTLYAGLEQQVDERTADLAARGAELQEVNLQLELTARHSQRRATLLHASAEVSRAVTQIRDLDELLPQVTQLISHHFGYYHSGIFLIDRPSGYAVLRAANSAGGQQMLARHHKLRIGSEGIVGFVTQTGQPRIAHDVGIDAVHFKTPELPDTRSEMALPLHIGADIIGALDVQSTEEAAFDEEDVAVLTGLADQIAIAIQNINLFQQTQAALAEAEDVQRRYLRQEWDSYLGGRPKKPAASQFEPVSLRSPYGTLDRAEKRTEHETETNPAQS